MKGVRNTSVVASASSLRVDDFDTNVDQSRLRFVSAPRTEARQTGGVHRSRGKWFGFNWPRSPSTGGWLSLHIAPSRLMVQLTLQIKAMLNWQLG
jgi:hypothetical protein